MGNNNTGADKHHIYTADFDRIANQYANRELNRSKKRTNRYGSANEFGLIDGLFATGSVVFLVILLGVLYFIGSFLF